VESWGDFEEELYRLNMSETISTSVSAAAIFSAEVGCGRPPPNRKDMVEGVAGTRREKARWPGGDSETRKL
jgi:hypothetical protein